jgi:hypothetical protein
MSAVTDRAAVQTGALHNARGLVGAKRWLGTAKASDIDSAIRMVKHYREGLDGCLGRMSDEDLRDWRRWVTSGDGGIDMVIGQACQECLALRASSRMAR